MFKILGADDKEYGPVTTEQLRQWIREGRAGGQTQVRPDGAAGWVALSTLPEVADIFATPALSSAGTTGSMPPVVGMLAFAMFVVAGISALLMIVNLASLLHIPASANYHPGTMFYVHWGMAVVSVPMRIIVGIGLLRRWSWARWLAVVLAAIWALFGAWGTIQMVQGWFEHPNMFPGVLLSPMYLISILWTAVTLLFNIATAVLLSRAEVRAAFSRKSSPTA